MEEDERLAVFEVLESFSGGSRVVKVLPRQLMEKRNGFYAGALSAIPFGNSIVLRLGETASARELYELVFEHIRPFYTALPEGDAKEAFPFLLHEVKPWSGVNLCWL